jgi:hypothetical protein
MSRFNNPLDNIGVAAPCPADWDGMVGSERVRYCGQCKLNVYNLSEMSRREAEALIQETEGRLCVRFYRRADGTIINRNCPVGLAALKRRLSRIGRALMSACLGFFAGLGFNAGLNRDDGPTPYGMRYATTGTMVVQQPMHAPVETIDRPTIHEGQMTIGRLPYKDADKLQGLKQRALQGSRR